GSKALPWLKKVKETTGLPVATEVANERHVHEALKYNLDVLWIGARTTANPFAVEEIANALEGTNIPVMIKSPINPDLNLWLGAIERLNQKGIKQLAAIHRGFSSYEESPYRNPPTWSIPEKLKTLAPNLPIINDPSHITGNRSLLYDISKKALDKQFDGLMIEVHPKPERALSDSNQQINPSDFHKLMSQLNLNDTNNMNPSELQQLRENIDFLDEELLEILNRRMQLIKQIGYYKKNKKLSIFQEDRWRNVLSKRLKNGKKKGLDQQFIKRIFETIHNESVTKQKQ
ncbi:MAG: chorismate mutase, partial [Bacteroidota bacterium]